MPATDLFISEIIEGSSFNKAVEIFNGTGAAVDLSGYTLELYSNGASSPSRTVALSGTLADGEVYVLAHGSADPAILAEADTTSSSVINFNGDDAIVLRRNGVIVDAFGQVGVDPGSEWPGGGQDDSLIRNANVMAGDTDASDPFDVSAEWQVRAQNDFSDLGTHTFGGGGPAPSTLVISELDADQTGTDAAEFVELFDGGAGNTSLDGYTLVLFNGSNDLAYDSISLDGYTTGANGYFVIGSSSVPNVDLAAFTTNGLQNGADAVALYRGAAPVTGDPVTVANLVDAVVYGTGDADDAGLLAGLGEARQWDEDANGQGTTQSLVRQADGSYLAAAPNPGGEPPPPPATITLISEIQGSVGTGPDAEVGVDDTSPLEGRTVTIRAVVTADFQDGFGTLGDLNGFYVQEEMVDWDASSLSSEGIFIFDGSNPAVDVQAGDLVEITGTVDEYFGETQIAALSVEVLQSGLALPDAVDISFPTASVMDDGSGGWVANLEAYEGMRVNIPQAMTITEMFNLDRFGEYRISDDRDVQFTQDNLPDQAGYLQHLKDVAAGSLVLDDGLSFQNPDPIRIIDGNDGVLTASDSFRMGDLISGGTGVLGYSFNEFRIQNGTGSFEKANPRPDAPEDVGGNFKVASLNVLNYFTTLDQGGAVTDIGLDPRGANSEAEFQRQAAKIVDAIVAIDADVMGLVEIENDFAGGDFAVKDLVDRLNAKVGKDVYAFVDPGQEFVGTDAIANALVYRKDKVALQGDMAILTTFGGRDFLDPLDAGRDLNRAAIAQTFKDLGTGQSLTVSVNHLKSKGSLSGIDADRPQGDGQGANNATRTAAADILADWLASDPTKQGATKQMIIGDLNAYAKEDPIRLLESKGFVDLAEADDLGAYSYVFDGQIGTLDYVLGNEAVASRVSGVAEWHINADEADALDYNLDFGRNPNLYTPDPTRYSDHDPVIVGLDLRNLITGTGKRDILVGTAADDEIRGGGGTDVMFGLKGDDLLIGGNKNDLAFGGAGDDVIVLGQGVNTASGDRGDDVLVFGEGRLNILSGDGGADSFAFRSGADADGLRSRTLVLDYDPTLDVVALGGAVIESVREAGFRTTLTLAGDGDVITFAGIRSLDQLVFAEDPLIV